MHKTKTHTTTRPFLCLTIVRWITFILAFSLNSFISFPPFVMLFQILFPSYSLVCTQILFIKGYPCSSFHPSLIVYMPLSFCLSIYVNKKVYISLSLTFSLSLSLSLSFSLSHIPCFFLSQLSLSSLHSTNQQTSLKLSKFNVLIH